MPACYDKDACKNFTDKYVQVFESKILINGSLHG